MNYNNKMQRSQVVLRLLAQLGVPDGHPVFVIFELQSAQETLLVQV